MNKNIEKRKGERERQRNCKNKKEGGRSGTRKINII